MEKCPLCGAETGGLEACRDTYFGDVLAREGSDPSGYGSVHLLTVDCYALQHSEDHSPRSNALHLTRLCWLLNGGNASIEQKDKGPIPYIMKHYYRKFPFLEPPPAGKRGDITILDLYRAKSAEEHIRLSREWGKSVREAYGKHLPWAKQMLAKAGAPIDL